MKPTYATNFVPRENDLVLTAPSSTEPPVARPVAPLPRPEPEPQPVATAARADTPDAVAPTLSVRLAHANPVLVRLAQSQPLQGHMGWHTSWHDNAGCTDAERELRWMDIRLALLTAEREAYNGPLFERWNEAHNAAADNHGAVRRLQESAAAQRAEVTRLVAGGVNPSAAEEGLDKVERELRHRTARCEILEAREATAKDAVERAATVAVLSVRKTETARVQQELGEVRAALQATVGQLLARLLVLQQVASLLERSRP